MSKKAFVNGKIYTANKNKKFTQSVVISDNKIIITGNNFEIKDYIDSDTEIIDLDNRVMLPGLIDSHMHLVYGALQMDSVKLENADSREQFRSVLSDYIMFGRGLKQIRGGNWKNQNWGGKMPDKSWIDDITGELPVILYRMDHHICLVNSHTLKLAGISKDTPNPEAGIIDKDPETGEPTGILREEALKLVENVFPKPDTNEKLFSTQKVVPYLNSLGITSIHDISGSAEIGIYQTLLERGLFNLRVYSITPLEDFDNLKNLAIHKGFGNEFVKIGAIKMFADGALGSETAWFHDSYLDKPGSYGMPSLSFGKKDIKEIAEEVDKSNLQLAIHAIGDRANSMVTNTLAYLRSVENRHRIEHGQHIKTEDIAKCANNEIIISAQPTHLYEDGDWIQEKLGEHRLPEAYPFKTMIEKNVKLCFGSDFPIVDANPMLGIHAAVTRCTREKRYDGGFIPFEKISVEDAVNCYTINAAYASFEEDIKGSIEPGKLADFVILDRDIFSIPQDEIKDTKVVATIIDGNVVYDA